MIDKLDEILRKLLIREIPIKNNEVDISFDQPKREWSSRVSQPTINLYVYDIHENNKLRMSKQMSVERSPANSNIATKRRPPIRLDIHYMVTAWANDPQDEHRLLASTLAAFLRNPFLPREVLPDELKDLERPIPVDVAQPDLLRNATDIWSVLDNEMRPAIGCTLTVPIDPYIPIESPIIRTREVVVGLAEHTNEPLTSQDVIEKEDIWLVGGIVRSEKPFADIQITLEERGEIIQIQPGGEYIIGKLRKGTYTLAISIAGDKPKKQKITVPSIDYNIDLTK